MAGVMLLMLTDPLTSILAPGENLATKSKAADPVAVSPDTIAFRL
jgi:hypothetical protein